eukprot:COSAG02_NODE_3102_length_7368_cov_92.599120_3_plen_63_part_00
MDLQKVPCCTSVSPDTVGFLHCTALPTSMEEEVESSSFGLPDYKTNPVLFIVVSTYYEWYHR